MKKIVVLMMGFFFITLLLACDEKKDPPKEEEPPKQYSKIDGYTYQTPVTDYELVWSDEFDYEGLPDSTKWGYDLGQSGWGNNELQNYTNDAKNARVEDGVLKIEAIKDEVGWTSARLVTRNKGDWKWGKIEVRAKLPTGRGTWPAIWMLPTDWAYGSWPNSGEIDIMEHVGYDQNRIHASIHTQAYYHKIGTQKSGSKTIPTASEEFHVYAVEWFPDKLVFTIDGSVYFSFYPFNFVQTPMNQHWPFDKRFHLLLNIAIGGDWGAAQGIDPNLDYALMEVDYVRVYQSPTIQNLLRKLY